MKVATPFITTNCRRPSALRSLGNWSVARWLASQLKFPSSRSRSKRAWASAVTASCIHSRTVASQWSLIFGSETSAFVWASRASARQSAALIIGQPCAPLAEESPAELPYREVPAIWGTTSSRARRSTRACSLFWRLACTTRDLSDTGAKIELPPEVSLPERFWVMNPILGIAREARVVWRQGEFAGIEFLPQSKGDGPLDRALRWMRGRWSSSTNDVSELDDPHDQGRKGGSDDLARAPRSPRGQDGQMVAREAQSGR